VREGVFQVNPASSGEQNNFNSGDTSFTLELNGSAVSMNEIPQQTGGGVTNRFWNREI
jgi:hypothetical protein